MPTNIAFLSQELSDYWQSAISQLQTLALVKVYHYPRNAEAPFKGMLAKTYVEKPSTVESLMFQVEEFGPNILIVSGWADKDYLEVARRFRESIPVVLCIDNPWMGTVKQNLNVVLRSRLKKFFNHAWGCGPNQLKYLRKLGFGNAKDGLYTANVDLYLESFRKRQLSLESRKKIIICIARYIPQKNYQRLWQAFVEFHKLHPEWQLHCFGFGEGWESRMIHPAIVHHGFVQPKELSGTIYSASAFILPSVSEHWGVVVHEMAVAGLPLLLSKAVESKHTFLDEGKNGYSFDPKQEESILKTLIRFAQLSKEERENMEIHSNKLGMSYTPEKWAQKALSFIE